METTVVALLLIVAVILAAIPLFKWIADRQTSDESFPLVFTMPPRPEGESLTPAPLRRPPEPRSAPVPPAPVHAPAPQHPQESCTETVRFRRPGDEPVQIVPGRLEVLAGDAQLSEIRFVRLPGQPLQLILGRDGGPSAQYVGLSSPTVSRRHAHFTYADGCWRVKNLSRTNPLVVNDHELSATADERTLVDGDRLELGEVVLRFHVH